MKGEMSWLISFFILIIISSAKSPFHNITTDQDALLALKNSIKPDNASQLLYRNWSSSSSVCDWIGVVCNSRNRVAKLDVSLMSITGSIPPQLGNLSFLIYLNMKRNKFYGELPAELSHLQRLKMLNLSNNSLHGEIPDSFGSLNQLKHLYLSNNSFSGIPTTISNLTNLEKLLLSNNSLQVYNPRGIGRLYKLKYFVMGEQPFIRY